MGGEPTVHAERRSNHETGGGTGQPQYGCCQFFGASHPANRLAAHKLGNGVLINTLNHGCIERARANGVNPDVLGCKLQGCAFGDSEHTVLGSVVGSATW